MPNGQNVFSRIEVLLVAKSFEKPTDLPFQTAKDTPIKQQLVGAVDTVRPFLPKTTPTVKAPVQQKQVPTTSPAMSPHRPD